jgi:chromate reductase
MRVLAVSGSLRNASYNTLLLHEAERLAPAGVDFDWYEELESVPPYNEDRDMGEAPPSAARLREAIAGADALLIATPEYNASIPGQLKNAVDWGSRPVRKGALWAKPVLVIGASTGTYGAVWAQAELRKVLATAGARVVDAEVAVGHAAERFDAEGRLTDVQLREELSEALGALVETVAPARLVAA